MATRVMKAMMSGLSELRFEPTEKRIRAMIDGQPVVDSSRAVLVWEPRRVVPSYAVPVDDVQAELQPSAEQAEGASSETGYHMPEVARVPVLTPEIRFQVHSAEGAPWMCEPPPRRARRWPSNWPTLISSGT